MVNGSRVLKTIAVGVTFVAAFLLVKEFKTLLFESASMQEASDAVTATAEKEIKLAQEKATDNKQSATENLIEKGRNHLTATLGAPKTDKEKFVAASNFFLITHDPQPI
jgi:hypothetical protein